MRNLSLHFLTVGMAFYIFVLMLSRKQCKTQTHSVNSMARFELFSFKLKTKIEITSLSS